VRRSIPAPGLYDSPITRALAESLAALPSADLIEQGALDATSAPHLLGRALYNRFVHALDALPAGPKDGPPKAERQLALANRVLELLAAESPKSGAGPDDHFVPPPRRLLAVFPEVASRLGAARAPARPGIALGTSELLVNGRHDLRVGTEVNRELASADSVDLLCSFLKWSGYRLVEEALRAFLERRPGGLRILTTAYMGATERRALDALHEMGATIKVSYDTERSRLHAKAWLFRRESGFSTACIGSSNLSHAAMLDGLEWNVRLS